MILTSHIDDFSTMSSYDALNLNSNDAKHIDIS